MTVPPTQAAPPLPATRRLHHTNDQMSRSRRIDGRLADLRAGPTPSPTLSASGAEPLSQIGRVADGERLGEELTP